MTPLWISTDLDTRGVASSRSPAGSAPTPPRTSPRTWFSHWSLALLAQGLSNQAVADRLYLAPRTVKTHVEHLLAKTGRTSRVQLAALAIAEGLGPAAPAEGPGSAGGTQPGPRDRPSAVG